MDRDEIIKKVLAAVAENIDSADIGPVAELDPSQPFSEWTVDSLMFVELQMALEDEFGIRMPDEDWTEILCLNDLYDYIQKRLAI